MSRACRVVVVDDEAPARERLERMVAGLANVELVGSFADALEALERLPKLNADLVLLDISMPGVDGLAAAERIAAMEDAPAVVFCTAHGEFGVKAFDAGAIGYLLKPVRIEKLEAALASAGRLNRLQLAMLRAGIEPDEGEELLVASHRGLEKIPLKLVSHFLADGKYTSAFVESREILLEESLASLEQRLGAEFVRCHRSALVRWSLVRSLQRDAHAGWNLRLEGVADPVPVSRRHRQELWDRLSKHPG